MDDDRLEELYRTYGAAIYSRCRRLLRDDSAAEDATQETFMRVQRHLEKAPSSRDALVWIYRIATNYCLNQIRNTKAGPVPVEELPELPNGSPGEESLANRDLAARLIIRAPEKLRAVAWLHYVDGLPHAEVAEVLGTSRRTVLYRLAQFIRNSQKFVRRAEA